MDSDLLSGTFVNLADTMAADFDVSDYMRLLADRSVELLAVSAAGVVLADRHGELRVAAASSQAGGLMMLGQIRDEQGPCLDCFRSGQPVTAADLTGPSRPWPGFAAAAAQAGFRAVEVLPMRRRDQVTGVLSLFLAGPGPLDPVALRAGQALADIATIGLLQERSRRGSQAAAGQLEAALHSRVIIEQAKGKLDERLSLDMDGAFRLLRDYARNSSQRLTDVARNFVNSATADFPRPPPRKNADTFPGQ